MSRTKNYPIKFPKKEQKKRRRAHRKSILHVKDGTCYLCMKQGNLRTWAYTEEHHIFGGPLRKTSEAEGFKVYLCAEHHRTGAHAVHTDAAMSWILKADAQAAFEKTGTRADFMALIGRNYLEE